jgi:hypothetical protein
MPKKKKMRAGQKGGAESKMLNVTHVRFAHRFQEPDEPGGGTTLKQRKGDKRKLKTKSVLEVADTIHDALTELFLRAESGDRLAIAHLLRLIGLAVGQFDGLRLCQNEIWRSLAREVLQWPILVTRNPGDWNEQRKWLEEMRLGEDSIMPMNRYSRTRITDAATRYAISIVFTIEDNRYASAESTVIAAPPWVHQARALPKLTKKTAAEWWKVGKQALLEVHPQPEKITSLHRQTGKANLRGDPQRRALIFELIGRAIYALARK